MENRFFVRMSGNLEDASAKIQDVFGDVDAKVVADGEFGFITDKMTEASYLEKATEFDNILGMIRVRF